MKENVSDKEGAVVDIDDILVHGKNKHEHDKRLHKVLTFSDLSPLLSTTLSKGEGWGEGAANS